MQRSVSVCMAVVAFLTVAAGARAQAVRASQFIAL